MACAITPPVSPSPAQSRKTPVSSGNCNKCGNNVVEPYPFPIVVTGYKANKANS